MAAILPSGAPGAQSGPAGPVTGCAAGAVPVAPDFEVLHAGRVYPDGDPAARIREQAQRLVREAARLGLVLTVAPRRHGECQVSVARVEA